jgi:cytochrome c553
MDLKPISNLSEASSRTSEIPSVRRPSGWRIARWILLVAAVSLALVALIGHGRFRARAQRRFDVALTAPAIPTDPASLARGRHLATTIGGCTECHAGDFAGKIMSRDAVLRLVAPNLTPGRGSAVRDYSDADWFRAIVHGVAPSGRSLLVMPAAELGKLSDADIAAIIAYSKSLPPIDRELPAAEVSPLGSVILGLAGAPILSAEPIDHDARRDHVAPAAGATREYGAYLSNVCRGCHGADLRGGIVVHPGAPPSADISPPAMASWKFEDFERSLRTGRARDGRPLDESMPWRVTSGLRDDEMRALWLALRHE